MKYEIITDSQDMLVLVVNSRVICITAEMSEIIAALSEDYTNHRNKVKRTYDPAIIHPELDDDMYKEDKLVAKGERLAITPSQRNEILHTKEGLDTTLGKLFNI